MSSKVNLKVCLLNNIILKLIPENKHLLWDINKVLLSKTILSTLY